MFLTRRDTLKLIAAGGVTGAVLSPASLALAADPRSLDVQTVGFTLAIHIPAILALHEELPKLGYGKTAQKRVEGMQVIAQSVVAGSTEIGDTDIVSVLRAADAGGKVKLIGLVYNGTSQVLVVDAAKIKDYKDFENPANAIALNSKGDFIYAMLAGVFQKNGVDLNKLTVIDVGGSGSRVKALLAGRVAAVPVHFDQAAGIVKQGNYQVMIEPWKIYDPWLGEGWVVNSAWLEKPENEKLAVDLMKAVIIAFRSASSDFNYFAAGYRKYATIEGAAQATDDALKPIWEHLVKNIRAWPRDAGFRRDYFKQLVPYYEAAGALRAGANVDAVVETRFIERALKELDA